MIRTIVLRNEAQIGALAVAKPELPTMLARTSNHLPTMRQVKRLHGPMALRELLHISGQRMSDLLAMFGWDITRQTVFTFERQERDKKLPKYYWSRRYMNRDGAAIYHAVIAKLVEWISGGKLTARVTGLRVWQMRVVRI